MEQMEPIAENRRADLIPPTWDPAKAAKRKVRIIKVSHDLDPMKVQTIFEFGGFVYVCYAKKTRGRSMIRCLGLADIERPLAKVVPEEMTAAIKDERVDYGLGDDKDIIDRIREQGRKIVKGADGNG